MEVKYVKRYFSILLFYIFFFFNLSNEHKAHAAMRGNSTAYGSVSERETTTKKAEATRTDPKHSAINAPYLGIKTNFVERTSKFGSKGSGIKVESVTINNHITNTKSTFHKIYGERGLLGGLMGRNKVGTVHVSHGENPVAIFEHKGKQVELKNGESYELENGAKLRMTDGHPHYISTDRKGNETIHDLGGEVK
jgi:hypothetical protein